MKATEVRAMSVEQLNEKLASLKKDLFFLRMQHATNQLDNPLKIAETKRDIARISAHYLNNVTTGVRLAGITKLIYYVYNGVHSSIVSDGVIGRGNVVINSAGDTDARNTTDAKVGSTSERTVATDANKTVNIVSLASSDSLLHTFLILEFVATSRVECSTTV
jgi:large subunit ribosomal protein L29